MLSFAYKLRRWSGLFIQGGFAAVFVAKHAAAADFNGHVRSGIGTSSVKFTEERTGETTNDSALFFSRIKLNVDDLNSSDDYITVDVRDHYDVFGLVDPELLDLRAENRFVLRELAYKRPYQSNRFYFSAGRFGVPEAGIAVNDGIELGYRVRPRLRLGIFGGVAQEDVVASAQFVEVEADAEYNPAQVGAYINYEKQSFNRLPAVYMSNAIALAPSLNVLAQSSRLFFHNQTVMLLNESHRFTSLFNYDLGPKVALRQLILSHYYTTRRIRAYTTYSYINVADYRLLKEIRETLEPSAYQSLRLRGIFRFTSNLSWQLIPLYARRNIDKLSKTDVATGPTYAGFFGRSLSMGILVGKRKNFTSDDTYSKFTSNYYGSSYSVTASYYKAKEVYKDETILNPQIISTDVGYFLSQSLRGSVGLSYLKDERVTATTFLFMIGYRFGDTTVSPIRQKVPIMEEQP